MDKIPFLPFLLQSLPESFTIVTFGLIIIDVKPSLKRVFIAVTLATFFSYEIRSLPIVFGIHSVLQVAFLMMMIILLLKHSLFQAATAVLLGSLALGFLESIMIPLILSLAGITFQDFLASAWLRVVVPLPYTFALGMLSYFIFKRRWVLVFFERIEWALQKPYKPVFYLIIIGLLQGFLLILINLTFYAYNVGYFLTLSLQALLGLTSIILLSAAGLTIVVAYFMLQIGQKETQLESEYRHLQGMQNIYLAVRQQRHDFINHVMSIYGFLKTGKNTTALMYIENIYTEARKNQALLNIDIPGLSGLIETKSVLADEKGISLKISVDPGFSKIPVKPYDLTGIVGNLLDNAIDAAQPVDSYTPSVWIELLHEEGIFTIVVENTGPPLAPEIKEKIFQIDFTTKTKDGHSGLGLFTVNNLVKKYNGDIKVDLPVRYQGVRFEVIITQKDRSVV